MATKSKHVILGVHIKNRMKKATEVQKVFSAYGCQIKTRIGLHDASEDHCSPSGVVLLELVGDAKTLSQFAAKLKAIAGVEVKQMVFSD